MAAMLADLPTLKAMMPAPNALTISDASETFWKLAGSDLFVLARPNREVVALHMTKPGWSAANVQRDLVRSTDLGEDASWWYNDGRLYQVFLQPINAGAAPNIQQLGILAVGYQVDSAVAQQLSDCCRKPDRPHHQRLGYRFHSAGPRRSRTSAATSLPGLFRQGQPPASWPSLRTNTPTPPFCSTVLPLLPLAAT